MDSGELGFKERLLALVKDWKPVYERVEVPDLGPVWLKKLTAGERDKFDPEYVNGGTRVTVLVHCCFDDRGMRLFSEEDVPYLELLDPEVIDSIVMQALRLNNLTKEAQERLAKNSNGQAVSVS